MAFIGCVALSRALLQELSRLPEVQVVGVVARASSTSNSDFANLDDVAAGMKAPLLHADDSTQEQIAEWLTPLRPDLVFCVGWSRLLKKVVLDVPKLGTIGYHPAELPENRGRHPIIWALALGLDQTASTFFLMDEGTDTGDILDQVRVPITKDDDAATLYGKLTQVACGQLTGLLAGFQRSTVVRRPQARGAGSSWRKRSKMDGLIDWRMNAEAICNLVRALTRPYPGAHCLYHGKEVKVWRALATASSKRNFEPGKVLDDAHGRIVIKAGIDAVVLVEHEFGSPPPAGSYL
jgi:methionyl-tRNA formyltransferase